MGTHTGHWSLLSAVSELLSPVVRCSRCGRSSLFSVGPLRFCRPRAQICSAEAQEVSFTYQQKLAEMTKFLFALGVSNIAMNRSIVRELELKLKGASEEELDELARREIISVVKQLKAQEDIMKKQSDLSDKVRIHESRINELTDKHTEHTDRIE